ncbi:MAG TPA: beta-ketoacyl synthase N-terminal-like domain-containing protein, partial [Phycisphaeraceae bacterium]
MSREREVVITGVGPVSGLGLGIEPTWQRLLAGESAVGPIQAFDPSGFPCRIGAEVQDFSVRDFVPKTYRKATKVMARDIELAVAAADLAARDAGLVTRGTDSDATPTYPPTRVGAHIGAGLIAAELNELTAALAESTDSEGRFDIHKWGREGMSHLTPLWLLKYLPNMLACHVTIIHDAQGPSNTITCNEASGGLSVGESLRVIRRGAADACFCGGADAKLNPMAFLRQVFTDRLNTQDNDRPQQAVRPFSVDAAGGVVGEGGGILILEAREAFERRAPGRAPYAVVAGFGASQTVHRPSRNLEPDLEGRSIALAIQAALRDAGVTPEHIDLIVPFGCASPAWDRAEA